MYGNAHKWPVIAASLATYYAAVLVVFGLVQGNVATAHIVALVGASMGLVVTLLAETLVSRARSRMASQVASQEEQTYSSSSGTPGYSFSDKADADAKLFEAKLFGPKRPRFSSSDDYSVTEGPTAADAIAYGLAGLDQAKPGGDTTAVGQYVADAWRIPPEVAERWRLMTRRKLVADVEAHRLAIQRARVQDAQDQAEVLRHRIADILERSKASFQVTAEKIAQMVAAQHALVVRYSEDDQGEVHVVNIITTRQDDSTDKIEDSGLLIDIAESIDSRLAELFASWALDDVPHGHSKIADWQALAADLRDLLIELGGEPNTVMGYPVRWAERVDDSQVDAGDFVADRIVTDWERPGGPVSYPVRDASRDATCDPASDPK